MADDKDLLAYVKSRGYSDEAAETILKYNREAVETDYNKEQAALHPAPEPELCRCNAMDIPHLHDKDGIHAPRKAEERPAGK